VLPGTPGGEVGPLSGGDDWDDGAARGRVDIGSWVSCPDEGLRLGVARWPVVNMAGADGPPIRERVVARKA